MKLPNEKIKRRGLLLVISAPSGGGKSAVLQKLVASEPDLTYSISMTSRTPRGEEQQGREYHFVSRDEFEKRARKGEFYEWAEVHGNLYGTREAVIEEALNAGRDVALDIDVQGGMDVKFRTPEAALVFLMPPSYETLEERLRSRGTDGEEEIQRRLKNARHEMQFWKQYDYIVTNNDLAQAVESVRAILHAERMRTRNLRLGTSS